MKTICHAISLLWRPSGSRAAGQPEERLLAAESMALLREIIEALPPLQRAVITLRDIQGWPAEEVCEALQLSQGNQRALLHRARSRVRSQLERYLERPAQPAG